MAYRTNRGQKKRTTRKPISRQAGRRSARTTINRAWTKEEISFMKKFYTKFETAWCARQLGRSTNSILHKAFELSLKKANPSVWKGNRGPANAFKSSCVKKTRSSSRRSKTTTKSKRTWRAAKR